MEKIGLQLYSVGKSIRERGLEPVLDDIAEAGFDCVEFAGFYGRTPEEWTKLLNDRGLKGVSAHINYGDVEKQLSYIDELGIKSVYVAWGGPFVKVTEEGKVSVLPDAVEAMTRVSKILAARGVTFGYHNHSLEYERGADAVEELMRLVPGLTSELDIFWAKMAGLNPTDLMKKYGDRLSAVHIKEMDNRTTVEPREFPQPVPGEGKSGCREAFALGKKMGIGLYVLEVEVFPCDVKEYLAKSAAAMKRMAAEA